MHASRRPYNRRPGHRPRHFDDQAVSEVVGQMIMFGILSVVLILSFVSFTTAKEKAEERVLDSHADSISQRVASLVVEASLFAEEHNARDVELATKLDLPQRIEGRAFDVDLDSGSVTVTIPSLKRSGTAPLFQAGAPSVVHVCDQAPIDGTSLFIRVTDQAHPAFPASDCPGIGAGELAVYLEIAP